MAILTDVKQALGIYYTEPTKDIEIKTMISGAKAFLKSAGFPSADLADDSETALATQAIIIYCKQANNTDPSEMRINPILVSMISQARNQPTEEETETEDGES